MKRKSATIKDRNELFDRLKNAGTLIMHPGHKLEPAAREFESEGLATIAETSHFHRAALLIAKAWN